MAINTTQGLSTAAQLKSLTSEGLLHTFCKLDIYESILSHPMLRIECQQQISEAPSISRPISFTQC